MTIFKLSFWKPNCNVYETCSKLATINKKKKLTPLILCNYLRYQFNICNIGYTRNSAIYSWLSITRTKTIYHYCQLHLLIIQAQNVVNMTKRISVYLQSILLPMTYICWKFSKLWKHLSVLYFLSHVTYVSSWVMWNPVM